MAMVLALVTLCFFSVQVIPMPPYDLAVPLCPSALPCRSSLPLRPTVLPLRSAPHLMQGRFLPFAQGRFFRHHTLRTKHKYAPIDWNQFSKPKPIHVFCPANRCDQPGADVDRLFELLRQLGCVRNFTKPDIKFPTGHVVETSGALT